MDCKKIMLCFINDFHFRTVKWFKDYDLYIMIDMIDEPIYNSDDESEAESDIESDFESYIDKSINIHSIRRVFRYATIIKTAMKRGHKLINKNDNMLTFETKSGKKVEYYVISEQECLSDKSIREKIANATTIYSSNIEEILRYGFKITDFPNLNLNELRWWCKICEYDVDYMTKHDHIKSHFHSDMKTFYSNITKMINDFEWQQYVEEVSNKN